MARQFDVPLFYQSEIISTVKDARQAADPRKKDLEPSVLDFGPVRFKIARHFGFCYGVENAIEIAYEALEENPGKRIFLLSEMIHNPHVNEDLQERGVDTETYDTTCPFVEKVWRKSDQIGEKDYSIVVHGRRYHEETRATISHAKEHGPVVVVRDMDEAEDLAAVVRGEKSPEFFYEQFEDRYSEGFDPKTDLRRVGVVNQTTMLATETQAIADLLSEAMQQRYGEANLEEHFADTSDTLCYATNENQDATLKLIEDGGDVALVVGGYNSSNTSHLVELCEEHMPTYFIRGASAIDGPERLQHFDLHAGEEREATDWLPNDDRPVDVVLNAGASCPDALLDEVLREVISWFPEARPVEDVIAPYQEKVEA